MPAQCLSQSEMCKNVKTQAVIKCFLLSIFGWQKHIVLVFFTRFHLTIPPASHSFTLMTAADSELGLQEYVVEFAAKSVVIALLHFSVTTLMYVSVTE